MNDILRRLRHIMPSQLGLLLGSLAFSASLTPSLIPRTALLQGIVAGLAFAISYGLAAGVGHVWRWLGVPEPALWRKAWLRQLTVLASLLIAAIGLARVTEWQNSIQDAMQLPEVESARPISVALVAVAIAILLLLIGIAFRRVWTYVAAWLARYLPYRVSVLGGLVMSFVIFWSIGDGLLLRGLLHTLDSTYREIDLFIPPDAAAPVESEKTGSPNSLVAWSTLGAQGRDRVLAPPTQADIAMLAGTEAMEPLRIYVGANSADTAKERAALALAELIRVGGFDRSMLVIATPTGTGWIDPAALAPLEILQRGDIASVSVQYSYLPSWLSLMVQPDYGEETARAVFSAVYGHWHNMPKAKRPRLYLFGLSLGSFNSDLSADAFDILADPYDGALWVGPPFASRTWRNVTHRRLADSPAWLPRVGDSGLFRFYNQSGSGAPDGSSWRATRIIYLQYASDPIVFFETSTLWRRPQWLNSPRGPDVSKDLQWIPLVTFLQLVCDMMTATLTPKGVGHVYAAGHYLDSWIALTDPQGWSEGDMVNVRKWFAEKNL